MKPLVLYCRWHDAKLRLFGRSETAVWGELAFKDHTDPFRFDLQQSLLTIGKGEKIQLLKLDDMGVVMD